jgi:uncharacterized membrane protein
MRSRAARITARVVGVLLVLVGALWVGQGLGLLPGSAMSGVSFWSWVGAACVLVGVALLIRSRRPVEPPA